jgi:hypothetical protein
MIIEGSLDYRRVSLSTRPYIILDPPAHDAILAQGGAKLKNPTLSSHGFSTLQLHSSHRFSTMPAPKEAKPRYGNYCDEVTPDRDSRTSSIPNVGRQEYVHSRCSGCHYNGQQSPIPDPSERLPDVRRRRIWNDSLRSLHRQWRLVSCATAVAANLDPVNRSARTMLGASSSRTRGDAVSMLTRRTHFLGRSLYLESGSRTQLFPRT